MCCGEAIQHRAQKAHDHDVSNQQIKRKFVVRFAPKDIFLCCGVCCCVCWSVCVCWYVVGVFVVCLLLCLVFVVCYWFGFMCFLCVAGVGAYSVWCIDGNCCPDLLFSSTHSFTALC